MRAQILALAVTTMFGVTACSIDVRQGGERRYTPLGRIAAPGDSSAAAGGMVIYPDARRVANSQTDPMNVGFAGNFSETRFDSETFESDAAPAVVLGFYRAAMRPHTEVIECRGNINIHRSRRVEKPVCIERSSSQVVQLATRARPSYRMVAVKPRGTVTEFTLASVYVR